MQPTGLQPSMQCLRDHLDRAADLSGRRLCGARATTSLAEIADGTSLDVPLATLYGKTVVVATQDQLHTAQALVEIDGVARRLVLCPPDLGDDALSKVVAQARADMIVADSEAGAGFDVPVIRCGLPLRAAGPTIARRIATEWVLMTSATTGVPKMVVHDFSSLTAAIKATNPADRPVWGTFYDIRRYGGLQIFLRAILAAGNMVLSSTGEPTGAFLRRLRSSGVTHISGTPSHWRRALMSGAGHVIAPKYIRLSGEIADQAILDCLHACFPDAAIGHAFASTEAGVAFEVDDGLEGFPANLLCRSVGGVEMRIEDGSLRIRSPRAATRYLATPEPLVCQDGFVDTGDMIEQRGSRCYFVGRRSGIINVGGLKVHPEEVEGVINLHRGVRMSLVRARRSPITGALVVADIVLKDGLPAAGEKCRAAALKDEILDICRDALPAHKVPTAIRFVPSLAVAPSGKLARPHA